MCKKELVSKQEYEEMKRKALLEYGVEMEIMRWKHYLGDDWEGIMDRMRKKKRNDRP